MDSRRKKGANRNIFVHIVPVNSNAAADKPPVSALLRCGAKEPWEPGQWRRNTAAVNERDDQLVICALNIDSVRNRFTGQSAHPKQ